jgi:hypothetical protein
VRRIGVGSLTPSQCVDVGRLGVCEFSGALLILLWFGSLSSTHLAPIHIVVASEPCAKAELYDRHKMRPVKDIGRVYPMLTKDLVVL